MAPRNHIVIGKKRKRSWAWLQFLRPGSHVRYRIPIQSPFRSSNRRSRLFCVALPIQALAIITLNRFLRTLFTFLLNFQKGHITLVEDSFHVLTQFSEGSYNACWGPSSLFNSMSKRVETLFDESFYIFTQFPEGP